MATEVHASVVDPAVGTNGHAPVRRLTPAMVQPFGGAVVTTITTGKHDDHRIGETREFDVELVKGLVGFGFSIFCRSGDVMYDALKPDIPNGQLITVYVNKLAPGGVAEQDGRMQPMDQIIEVDGHSLIDVTYEQASTVLRNTRGKVRLRVRRQNDTTDNNKLHKTVAGQGQGHINGVVSSQRTDQVSFKADVSKHQKTDINSNVVDCKNREVSRLRQHLLEAQKRRTELNQELNQVNMQISLCSTSQTKTADDAMKTRLAEAESATKKAQRDMIELQTSLNTTQKQYTELETSLRCTFNDLLTKYSETQDIMLQCRDKDTAYSAEREAIRRRHLESETKYKQQMSVLNDKVGYALRNYTLESCTGRAGYDKRAGQLLQHGHPTGLSIDETLLQIIQLQQSRENIPDDDDAEVRSVLLLTHTAIGDDGSRQTKSSRQPPALLVRSATSSDTDDEQSRVAEPTSGQYSFEQRTANASRTTSTVAGAADDTWSTANFDEEPPDYPPPPVPDDDEDSDDSSDLSDVEPLRASANNGGSQPHQDTAVDPTRARLLAAAENPADRVSVASRSSRQSKGHRRTESRDEELATTGGGTLERQKKKPPSFGKGPGRFRRMFAPKSAAKDDGSASSDDESKPEKSSHHKSKHRHAERRQAEQVERSNDVGNAEQQQQHEKKRNSHGIRMFWNKDNRKDAAGTSEQINGGSGDNRLQVPEEPKKRNRFSPKKGSDRDGSRTSQSGLAIQTSAAASPAEMAGDGTERGVPGKAEEKGRRSSKLMSMLRVGRSNHDKSAAAVTVSVNATGGSAAAGSTNGS